MKNEEHPEACWRDRDYSRYRFILSRQFHDSRMDRDFHGCRRDCFAGKTLE